MHFREQFVLTPYMTTPYAAVSGGTKDAYNVYYSHLQIRKECSTFGILTHRWAILRSAIPANISIGKTVALVVALAKLHNYWINANDNDISANTARNEWTSEINGSVPLVRVEGNGEGSEVVPEQLLHGGAHFDDIGHAGHRCRLRHYKFVTKAPLLREQLHSYTAAIGATRPYSVQRP
jgi:hypothetical protein